MQASNFIASRFLQKLSVELILNAFCIFFWFLNFGVNFIVMNLNLATVFNVWLWWRRLPIGPFCEHNSEFCRSSFRVSWSKSSSYRPKHFIGLSKDQFFHTEGRIFDPNLNKNKQKTKIEKPEIEKLEIIGIKSEAFCDIKSVSYWTFNLKDYQNASIFG